MRPRRRRPPPREAGWSSRTFLEQSDDLVALQRHRLWPYCLREQHVDEKEPHRGSLDGLPKLPALPARPSTADAKVQAVEVQHPHKRQRVVENDEVALLEAELRDIERQLTALTKDQQAGMITRNPRYYEEEQQAEYHPFRRSVALHDAAMEKLMDKEGTEAAVKKALEALERSKNVAERAAGLEAVKQRGAVCAADAAMRTLALAAATAAKAAEEDRQRADAKRRRDDLAEQHVQGQLEIECPQCAMLVPVHKMRQHLEVCPNKLVPCKNAVHGCKCMVRPLNRDWHENADHLARPRPCLFFPGAERQRSFVALDEPDLDPPWTAEYWLWRPGHSDAARTTLRAAVELRSTWLQDELEAATARLAVANVETEARDVLGSPGNGDSDRVTDELLRRHEVLGDKRVKAGVSRARYYELLRTLLRHLNELTDPAAAIKPVLTTPPGTQKTKAEKTAPVEDPPNQDDKTKKEGDDAEDEDDDDKEMTVFEQSLESKLIEAQTLLALANEKTVVETIRQWATEMNEEKKPEKKEMEKEEVWRAKTAKGKRARMRAKRKAKLQAKKAKARASVHGVPVEARIAAEVKDCGRCALASSDDVKLLLDVDVDGGKILEKDVLGISFAGVGTFAIAATSAPREKWVHVAIVATAKHHLKVFFDGVKAFDEPFTPPPTVLVNTKKRGDRRKKSALRLPMRDLGGDRKAEGIAFHGLMLETRYWATARTKNELDADRHALPPDDAKANGLIGWWTFEEGEGKWLYDRSENRYRSHIRGPFHWAPAEEASGGLEPPTPASRERGICQVELRRVRFAAKGRERFQVTDCLQCYAPIIRSQMRFHLEWECIQRKRPCLYCGEPIAFFDKEKRRHHERGEESSFATTSTPLCPVLAERNRFVDLHVKATELIDCDLGCDLQIKRCDMDRHCATECVQRLVPCPQGCGVKVPSSRLKLHMRFFCDNPFFIAARKMAFLYRKHHRYHRAWALLKETSSSH